MNTVFEKPEWKYPIRTVKRFFTSLKWAWQRATKGYCDLDTYGVSDWFLNTLPDMLESIKKNRVGFPSDLPDDCGDEKWDDILSEMIFLLREANEDTCSKVNPYEEEYHRILEEFREKYGEWGEKLSTKEEKAQAKKTGNHPVYMPAHLPEYKEICELFMNGEQKISEYQVQCKDKAIEMFSKWFYSLW